MTWFRRRTREGGAWGVKFVVLLFLITGFECITVTDAAPYTYPKLNPYAWTITTNRTLGSYSDLVTPKIVLDDAPPPPSYAERARNQQVSRERQEKYRKRVPIPNALSGDIREAYLAKSSQNQNAPPASAPSAGGGYFLRFLLYAAVFCLMGLLAICRFAPDLLLNFQRELNPWTLNPDKAAIFSAKVRAEEEAFARFMATFRVGPASPNASDDSPGNEAAKTRAKRDPVREFIERTAGILLAQRKSFEDIDRAWTDAARRKMMAELRREMGALMVEAHFPEVLLIWQVASAIDGLLKQLIDRTENINASTLRTIRGGVDLLTDLCSPAFKPDLLNERPLRFLAVDDDLISRQALSVALKKALNEPNLAIDGQGAIVLANKYPYDVIFLDVEMPDMDGFELCTKIHQTETNRTTPVIFVTGQSDFDARAQSTLSGGTDLMAKPFLTFEVTVKALTLALRGRMEEHKNGVASLTKDNTVVKTLMKQPPQSIEPVSVATDVEDSAPVRAFPAAPADKPVAEFLARARKQLPALKKNCRKILETSDVKMRQDNIADAFLRVHSFIPDVTLALKHPAFQMGVALEGLLRKLLEDQKNYSESAVTTAVAAVDLLRDLCAPGMVTDLATHPPVEILVVDDDVISRRAIAVALQLVFEKPEAVGSGEAALAVTAEKAFDVIFMDVVMPGMDGFAVCAKIRECKLNHNTPVVFVTGQSDYAARAQMTQSGGSDLMGKPFLASEITVKALTFAMRGRLQKQKPSVRQ